MFLHEHGYRASWRDGELIVLDPRGCRVLAEPPRTVRAPLGWAAIRAAATDVPITIDDATGLTRRNGCPVDHDWLVHDRVRHEHRPAGPGLDVVLTFGHPVTAMVLEPTAW